ncbi:HlyD family secretion protein [Burkholderia dolosa]|uniref:HlyD family secretion protein n=1 Tax=Burkholderia dolosa TaxID=152500 RepID=A0A892I7V8_9BURK|nr:MULTISPECIES: HlyD family secretion protein [Burkholderia]AKE01786.1 hemolysin D [Burkholderia cepacia]AJY11518.1 efflux transporter, RND family, MFP subunit [Burkholderia dolosa AU0158]AYZ95796.1 HlyD family secretion protein [Burkholderia dolosa]ETP61535.1 hemolysin D [Burkholderia dolosa PC543]MBR8420863.1 HlyD family secretion protein [Burkholderia dolosa]
MTAPSPDTLPTTAARSHRPAIVAIAVLALLLVALLVYEFDARDLGTDDAYVTGHLHVISPRVAGTVERVRVDDNQFVRAGAPLVQIDRRDFDVRVAAQRARAAQARADASRARAQIEQADAALVSARADAEKAELDYARARELTRETPRGLSKQEFDAADAARKSARARVAAADAQRRSALAASQAADAAAGQSDAELHDALLQLQYTTVVAPSDGYVGKKTVETGEHVAPGQALLTLVEPHPWIVANFRETQLRHVRTGDAVQLRFDALPQRVFAGRIDSLSPATGAQFALLPPDNATGNFTKVTQRVPVKILLDGPAATEPRIRPGLSVVVTLQRSRESR